MEPHCKIGRIVFKDSKISPLRIEKNDDERLARALTNFRECWQRTGDVDGYIMIVWDKSAGFHRAAYIGDAVPLTLIPSWIGEVARRWIAEDCASDIISGKI